MSNKCRYVWTMIRIRLHIDFTCSAAMVGGSLNHDRVTNGSFPCNLELRVRINWNLAELLGNAAYVACLPFL